MRTVRDGDGRRYVLLKESGDSSLVRELATGTERWLPNDRLAASGESPLSVAARAVPAGDRGAVPSAGDERAIGLLVELRRRGAVAVRDLLADYDLCESDLHGAVAEFRAAGLVRETAVGGERGYELAPDGRDLVDRLTDGPDDA